MLQVPQNSARASVAQLLHDVAREAQADTAEVAVAYASVAGLHRFLSAVSEDRVVTKSRWVVGLDDLLTHPGVLDVLESRSDATVRVAGERINGSRFHPKLFHLANSDQSARSALVIGSANLTIGGLSGNVEAATAMVSNSAADAASFRATWRQAWATGTPLTAKILSAYREDFDQELNRRKAMTAARPKTGGLVLQSDLALTDPTMARVCWIEVGNITGFNSEQLEIKAEQALFFGLASAGGQDAELTVTLASGAQVKIAAKYRGNAMWRFNLPQSIPEVGAGLRPGGSRSPYIAVFERLPKRKIGLNFLQKSSKTAGVLRRRSHLTGTLGSTTAREYGWY
jgi:hypothetical protein